MTQRSSATPGDPESEKKARIRRWAGIAFAVAAAISAAGTLVVGFGGDWLGAGRGAALTGVFVIASLVRLKWGGRSSPLLDTLTVGFAVAFVVLLVAAG